MQIGVTLTVEYNLNGESVETMRHQLEQALEREIGSGALTGETAAEVDAWRLDCSHREEG